MVYIANTPLAKAVQHAAKRDAESLRMSGRIGHAKDPKNRWDKIVEAIGKLENRVEALERK